MRGTQRRDADVSRADAFEPIGISCRICERDSCHQRSVPPLERRLQVNSDQRGVLLIAWQSNKRAAKLKQFQKVPASPSRT